MDIAVTNIFKRVIRKFELNTSDINRLLKNESNNSWKGFLKKVFPWTAAALFLIYLFHSIDFTAFIEALLHINLMIYLPWLFLFGISAFLTDAQNLKVLLAKFDYDVSYKKLLYIRGVSYLAMVVNFTLGIGSISLCLKRYAGIPLLRSASILLVYNSATQNCLAFIAAAGCLFFADSSTIPDKIFVLCLSILSISVIIIVTLKLLPERGRLLKFKQFEIVKVFYELPWKSYIVITFWRGCYYLTFLVFFYYAVRAFNMQIPIGALVVYVPMILLIISLPVTPFGLGTSQAAMILFFNGYGSEATILAFSLTYSTSVILVRGLIGILFLSNIQERFL